VSRSIAITFEPLAASIIGFIRKTSYLEAIYLSGLSEGLGTSEIGSEYYPSSGFVVVDEERTDLLSLSHSSLDTEFVTTYSLNLETLTFTSGLARFTMAYDVIGFSKPDENSWARLDTYINGFSSERADNGFVLNLNDPPTPEYDEYDEYPLYCKFNAPTTCDALMITSISDTEDNLPIMITLTCILWDYGDCSNYFYI
jgi:hypothetical protein